MEFQVCHSCEEEIFFIDLNHFHKGVASTNILLTYIASFIASADDTKKKIKNLCLIFVVTAIQKRKEQPRLGSSLFE